MFSLKGIFFLLRRTNEDEKCADVKKLPPNFRTQPDRGEEKVGPELKSVTEFFTENVERKNNSPGHTQLLGVT